MAVPAHSKSRAPRTAPAEGRLFCSLAMAFTLGLAASVALGAEDAQTLAVTGTVFMDRNRNARQDPGEIGLAGALVSDGERFVETDQDVVERRIALEGREAGQGVHLLVRELQRVLHLHGHQRPPQALHVLATTRLIH